MSGFSMCRTKDERSSAIVHCSIASVLPVTGALRCWLPASAFDDVDRALTGERERSLEISYLY